MMKLCQILSVTIVDLMTWAIAFMPLKLSFQTIIHICTISFEYSKVLHCCSTVLLYDTVLPNPIRHNSGSNDLSHRIFCALQVCFRSTVLVLEYSKSIVKVSTRVQYKIHKSTTENQLECSTGGRIRSVTIVDLMTARAPLHLPWAERLHLRWHNISFPRCEMSNYKSSPPCHQ